MDRRTFRAFALTLGGLVAVVALVAMLGGGAGSGPTRTPEGEQAVGVVTSIDSEGLTDVRGFVLRTRDGRDLAFRIGVLENGAQFPPGHLGEHQTLRTLVRVWYREEGTERVAFRLEDAE